MIGESHFGAGRARYGVSLEGDRTQISREGVGSQNVVD